jgi:uncharacterized protein
VVLILRARDRSAIPWKNGGGFTHEVAAHPPGCDLDSFLWRVSIAEVRTAGPFSSFAGVERQMAVLAGRLRLTLAGRDSLYLTPETAPVSFAGDLPAFAEPLGAPVTDLNVMTRRGHFGAQLARRRLLGLTSLASGSVTTVMVALTELSLRALEGHWHLSPLDAALIESVERVEIAGHAAEAGAQSASLYLAQMRPDAAVL